MSTDDPKETDKARKAAAREARLAEALRANMKRRKAQARARSSAGAEKPAQAGPKDS